MKITFCYRSNENFGIEYMSAVLKQHGHSVQLVYHPGLFNDGYISFPNISKLFYSEDAYIARVVATNPDMVCFSVMTDGYLWACRIAERIKNILNVPIIFGGIHPTSVPDKVIANKFVDIICIGEGEFALLDLCDNIDRKDVPNLWIKKSGVIYKNAPRQLIQNLDGLPFLDKRLFYDQMPQLKKRVDYTIITSRGCPYLCTYCCNHVVRNAYKKLDGAYYRKRSVDNVIAELKIAMREYQPSSISFIDDMFVSTKEWIEEFSDKYQQAIGLPFQCIGMIKGFTEDIVSLLRSAGCIQINFGVQTPNENVRRTILRRPETNDSIIKTAGIIKKYSIGLTIDHIMGIPKESEVEQIHAVEMYNEMRPNMINNFYMKYFPKTEMTDFALKCGQISMKYVDSVENGFGASYHEGGQLDKEKYQYYRFMFGIIPLFPKKWISYILKYKLYKLVPRSNFIAFILPRFIASFFWGDIRVKRYLKTYLQLSNYVR